MDDEFSNGRQRPANYIQICINIADSYPYGIPHGVQKDAIQNAIDAIKGKGPLKMEFELVKNEKGRFFTMTDSNTLGLTGPVLDFEDYEKDLPEEYHWARFESFAFTKDSPDAIGARGQGKFIFLCASKKYHMYYDSLRGDGIYRVGATHATRTGCPIFPDKDKWEGKCGADLLKQKCGLDPLRLVGTRVIIVDPIEELIESLENGSFSRAIHETWFRAIEKKRANITICHKKKSGEVTLSFPYPLPRRDSKDHKVWNVENKEIRISTGECYRIKRLSAVYLSSGKVTEEMQGIAIIHNSMKITSLPMNSAPPQIREKVTGFVEFDRELDHELRKGENQHPNHYDLKWRRRIPHEIKAFVNNQLEEFGKKKLGLGTDYRQIKNRHRINAEEWAMRNLIKYAHDLDLFGAKGPKPPPPPPPPPPPLKPIGVSISNFVFPDPEIAPRVNWGQKFEGLGVTAYNRKGKTRRVAVRLHVLYGDLDVVPIINSERLNLVFNEQSQLGPFDIPIEKKTMTETGEYRLVASLFDSGTGDRLDHVTRRFWVEKDPPFKKPFDLQPTSGFPEPNQKRQWLTGGSINNSPVVYYNVEHPAYKLSEDSGEEQQQDYLFQIVLEAAIDFILKRPNQKDGTPDYHPLEGERILCSQQKRIDRDEVPTKTYNEIIRFVSEIRWRMLKEE